MGTLNESAIGDIIDVITAFADVIKDNDEKGFAAILAKKFGKGNPYKGSITRQANNLVMTFPVLISNTIEPTVALTISKAIERKMVVLLQMLFASAVLVADGGTGTVQDVVRKYYTGIDFKTMTVDDVNKILDRMDLTEAQISEIKWATNYALSYLAEAGKTAVNAKPAEISNFEEDAIGNYSISGSSIRHDSAILTEAKKNNNNDGFIGIPGNDYEEMINNFTSSMYPGMIYDNLSDNQKKRVDEHLRVIQGLVNMSDNELNKELDRRAKETKIEVDRENLKLAKERDKREKIKSIFDAEKHKLDMMRLSADEKDRYINALNKARGVEAHDLDFFKKQLLDSDVKKCNEMVPSMLAVNFYVAGGNDVIRETGIVGIKSRLIPVSSNEIIDRIASKNKAKAGFVNLIRATSGEIKFMKDFIFNIDRAKIDALAKSKKGSVNPMWRVLERRANKQNLRKALAQRNDASPITTLILTSEEVDYLKKTQAIDLNNVSIAADLLEAYNFLGIGIVDQAAEVVKFMWDGEMKGFEPVSFLAMEREDREGGGTYKKVINLMASQRG